MATTYLTPGVYVEEVPSGMSTLTAGATAVAAFVGFTAKGPSDDPADPQGLKPRLVTNWTQFEELYGGFVPGAMLPHSVYGYFNNGGSLAYIVRIPHTEPSTEPGVLALPAADRTLGPAVEVTTIEPNADISVTITPEPPADDAEDGAADVPPRRASRTDRAGRELRRADAQAGRPQRRHGRQQGVDEDQGGDQGRHVASSPTTSRRCRPARFAVEPAPADAGRRPRPSLRRLRDRPHGHQRPGHRRRRHDGDGPRPHHRGHARTTAPVDLEHVEDRAARAHQPLRGPGATAWPSSTRPRA